jgi:hypothetical protein
MTLRWSVNSNRDDQKDRLSPVLDKPLTTGTSKSKEQFKTWDKIRGARDSRSTLDLHAYVYCILVSHFLQYISSLVPPK